MRNFRRLGSLLLLISIGDLLQTVAGANLKISPSGLDQKQPAGKGFVLMCKGEAENQELFSEMKWHGPSGELPSSVGSQKDIYFMNKDFVLVFRTPTTEDSGTYTCSGMYDSTDRLNISVNLVFYQDITWEDCPQEQALVINTDGKIRCRVSANPPPTISWSKEGVSLEKSDDRYMTETDGIRVSSVTEEDKGNFDVKAMVSQTGNFQTRTIKVEVHKPPDIIQMEGNTEFKEGEEATLSCQATGFPKPSYAWFDRDERDLSRVDGHSVDADSGTITFFSIKREEQGQYTCMAKNPAGEAKRSIDLTVIVKPEIVEFNNVISVETNATTLECHARGDPLPNLSFRKKEGDVPIPDEDDRISKFQRKEADKAVLTLNIRNTLRSDDGTYYCVAENKGGVVEKEGHLAVQFAPVMGSTPTTSVKTWNGKAMNLTCIAESIPNATITWTYQSQPIRDSNVYKIYGTAGYSNLEVKPPLDLNRDGTSVYGTYRCSATNPYGSQFINIELSEARTPGVIMRTSVEKKTATTITFRFNGPEDNGGLPVRGYAVRYYDESMSEDVVNHEWNEGSTYVLDRLRPKAAYRFRFAARNDVGIGEYSEQIREQMPEQSPPEPPKFTSPTRNISTYPDRVQIRWTLPLDNGEKIDYFELRYFVVEHRNNEWKGIGDTVVKNIYDWENAPSYEMKNLKPNTHYKVEVRAHNSLGFSQDATMMFQTAADPSKRSQGRSPVHLPGSGHEGLRDDYSDGSGLSGGVIGAIIFIVILLILIAIVVDVFRCKRSQRGVLFTIRNHFSAKTGDKDLEDGKGASEVPANNGNVKADSNDSKANEKGESTEKKSKTEIDNFGFDKEKELQMNQLNAKEATDKDNEGDVATEETPMIQTSGAKDTKPSDDKNKSPKGSKSSIAKDSIV